MKKERESALFSCFSLSIKPGCGWDFFNRQKAVRHKVPDSFLHKY